MKPPHDTNSTLIVPFLNDDPVYAYGVEFGMLHEQMKRTKRIHGYYTVANQEQITLLANRLGWTIRSMKICEDLRSQWFHLDMVLPETPHPPH